MRIELLVVVGVLITQSNAILAYKIAQVTAISENFLATHPVDEVRTVADAIRFEQDLLQLGLDVGKSHRTLFTEAATRLDTHFVAAIERIGRDRTLSQVLSEIVPQQLALWPQAFGMCLRVFQQFYLLHGIAADLLAETVGDRQVADQLDAIIQPLQLDVYAVSAKSRVKFEQVVAQFIDDANRLQRNLRGQPGAEDALRLGVLRLWQEVARECTDFLHDFSVDSFQIHFRSDRAIEALLDRV